MGMLGEHLTRYDREHRHPWNKFLHGVGIPVILGGITLVALTRWELGMVLFLFGWALLFLGHRIEGNNPAFLQGGLVYFLVGPVWVGREIKALLRKGSSARAASD